MQLAHIPLANLSISAANMRAGRKAPDISDILPSVRARGVLVPLLVRKNGSPETYEIVAGRRRFHAAQTVADEGGDREALPCAIIEAGDDAAAVEASLLENVARLDPDEVTRWQTFTRLIREGRTVDDICTVFGLTELMVKRVLALGNLHPRIRKLYSEQQIDAATVQQLTLAPMTRQKEWLALYRDPDVRSPCGHQLRAWLFGGASISTKVALFDLADYPAAITSDLFGDDSLFSDSQVFWPLQQQAIEAKATTYREAGWTVQLLPRGASFHRWEHEKATKAKGGKIFITLSGRGEVEVHEGWVSRREAERLARGEAKAVKPVRSEITSAMQTYVDLHRHAAVRATLVDRPMVALRLAVAHMIAGSSLWSVRVEPQRAANDATAHSLAASAAEKLFAIKRREVLELLGFDSSDATVVGSRVRDIDVPGLFSRLLTLDEGVVLTLLAVVMGETLEAGSAAVEVAGRHLGTDMRNLYAPDEALVDGIRDREVLLAMVAQLAGTEIAAANSGEKIAALKAIIRDCLAGTKGRPKVEGWLPSWLTFPARNFTDRGGLKQVALTEW